MHAKSVVSAAPDAVEVNSHIEVNEMTPLRTKNDWEIEQDIEKALFRSSFVDASGAKPIGSRPRAGRLQT